MDLSFLPFKLMQHQEEAVKKFFQYGRLYCVHETGTGKTYVYMAIMILVDLFEANIEELKILIVCPKTLIKGLWLPIIQQYELDYLNIKVINYEYLMRHPDLLNGIDLLICDEAHKITNHTAKISKKLYDCKAKYRILGTGTPLPRNYTDFYAPLKILGIIQETVSKWCLKYGWYNRKTFKYIAYKSGLDRLIKDYSCFLHEARLDDIPNNNLLEPERIVIKLKQEAEFIKTYASYGYLSNEQQIQTNDLSLAVILRQICSDVYKSTQNELSFKFDGKMKELTDILRDITYPIIIWITFRAEAERIFNEIKNPKKALWIGGTEKNIDDWNNGNIDILIANAKSCGVGLNLQRCSNVIYHTIDWSLTDYKQSLARVYRLGQTSQVRSYYLIYENSLEEKILKVLEKKDATEQEIKNLIKQEIERLQNESI